MKIIPFSEVKAEEYFHVRVERNVTDEEYQCIHEVNVDALALYSRYGHKPFLTLRRPSGESAGCYIVGGGNVPPFQMEDDHLVIVGTLPSRFTYERFDFENDRFIANPMLTFNFAQALKMLTEKRVAVRRERWPEGDMVFLELGSFDFSTPYPMGGNILDVSCELFEHGNTGTTTRLPNFVHAFDCGRIRGWTPSAHDLLAEDWHVAKPKKEE